MTRASGQGRQLVAADPTPWRTGSALAFSLYRTGEVPEAQAILAESGVLAEQHGEKLG